MNFDKKVLNTSDQIKQQQTQNMMDSSNKELMNFGSEDGDENNALHMAAANGHEDIVEFLLDRGFAVDATNTYGWTALMQSARNGHTAVVNVLLRRGADVLLKNRMGTSALECGARSGHLSTVEALLLAQPGSRTDSGSEMTPLMVASQFRHNSIVTLLLEAGADVNRKFPITGMTALMLAAVGGHDSTARLLVEHGADVTATNNIGMNALDIAVQRGKRQVRSFLDQCMALTQKSESETVENLLFEAIYQEDMEQVKIMIKANPEVVHCVDKSDGQTPLIRAVVSGRLDIVSLILDSSAEIDRYDNYGYTPLMHAIFCGHNEIALYLMGAGADINHYKPEKCPYTPFDIATLVGHPNKEVIIGLTDMMGFNNGSKKKTEKELKKNWWERTSKYFQKKKSSRAECSKQAVPRPKGKRLPSTDPSPRLLSVSPCDGYLHSNHLPVVVSPLLPCYGLDSSIGSRYGMPPGLRKMPAASADCKPCTVATMVSLQGLSLAEDSAKSEIDDSAKDDQYDLNDSLHRHLAAMSLKHHYNIFRESEVDLEAFRLLTESDLIEMGIEETLSRKLILDSIDKLNKI